MTWQIDLAWWGLRALGDVGLIFELEIFEKLGISKEEWINIYVKAAKGYKGEG